jgi:hypothetical protein
LCALAEGISYKRNKIAIFESKSTDILILIIIVNYGFFPETAQGRRIPVGGASLWARHAPLPSLAAGCLAIEAAFDLRRCSTLRARPDEQVKARRSSDWRLVGRA